jgi:hypothetical protein
MSKHVQNVNVAPANNIAPAAPKGPYGPVEFAKPKRVAATTKYGRTYCPAIVVKVPLRSIPGLSIETIVLASRKETAEGMSVEYSTLFPRSLNAEGDMADEIRDTFIAHVNTAAEGWAGYDAAIDAAWAALTGEKVAVKVPVPVLVRRDGKRTQPGA